MITVFVNCLTICVIIFIIVARKTIDLIIIQIVCMHYRVYEKCTKCVTNASA